MASGNDLSVIRPPRFLIGGETRLALAVTLLLLSVARSLLAGGIFSYRGL